MHSHTHTHSHKSVYTLADVRPHQPNQSSQAHSGFVTPALPLAPASVGLVQRPAQRTAAQLFRAGGAMYRTRMSGRECFLPSPALRFHFSGPLALTRGLAFLDECRRDASLRRLVESFGIELDEWAEQIEQAQAEARLWNSQHSQQNREAQA